MAYKGKVWDGTAWQDLANSVTDTSKFVLKTGTTGAIDLSTATSITVGDGYGLPYPNRNLIYNGAMQVAQRGISATGITSNSYNTADRWMLAGATSTGTWTNTIENDAPTGSGFRRSLKILCSTIKNPLDAGSTWVLRQPFEGQDLQRILKGTSSAQQLTLSFWVKSNVTGIYIAELYDPDNTRQVSTSYTIIASNVWEKKTVTFPADTIGAFDNDNAESLALAFHLVDGTNYTSGALNTTWGTAVTANRAGGQVNLAAAVNNYWQVTGVQLETGPIATSFEFKSYGQELRECQRYFQVIGEGLNDFLIMGQTFSNGAYGVYRFPVIMRAVPSSIKYSNLSHFTGWDAGTNNRTPLTSLNMDNTTNKGTRITWAAASLGTSAMSTLFINNASGYLWITAEL